MKTRIPRRLVVSGLAVHPEWTVLLPVGSESVPHRAIRATPVKGPEHVVGIARNSVSGERIRVLMVMADDVEVVDDA